jgi:hypothetical protein
MQPSATDYALTYFTTLKWQLVTLTVVRLTTSKFKHLILPMHDLFLSNCMYRVAHEMIQYLI